MTKTEKILVVIVIITLGLQVFVFSGKAALFFLMCWILALVYAINGYKILGNKELSEKTVSKIGGIAMASSIAIIPFLIKHWTELIFKLIPIINILFCVVLGIYWIFKKKGFSKRKKGIFIRSLIISLFTIFFAYQNYSSKPYREAIKLFNKEGTLYYNVKTFDFQYLLRDSYKNGNCDMAIKYAEEEKKYGLLSIKLDTFDIKDTSFINKVFNIRFVFSDLYQAYKCNADELYNNEQYKKAVWFYEKADSFLLFNTEKFWQKERVWSYSRIANTYKDLNDYTKADTFYIKAIEHYSAIKDTVKADLATLYENYAISLTNQTYYDEANHLFKIANQLYRNYSLEQEDMFSNYYHLVKNYFSTDSLNAINSNLDSIQKLVGENIREHGRYYLFRGMYYYKLNNYQKALECALISKKIHSETFESMDSGFLVIYSLLAQCSMVLDDYNSAQKHIENGISILTNLNKKDIVYAEFMKIKALLKFNTSKYKEAEKLYNEALQIYLYDHDENNFQLIDYYSGLSDAKLKLNKLEGAKKYAEKSISIIKANNGLSYLSNTTYINQFGYINYFGGNYRVADTLYSNVIQLHEQNQKNRTENLSNAYNGLGLIALNKKRFKDADSLFHKSIEISESIYGRNHTEIATIEYNIAKLRIKQKKYDEAEELLKHALETYNTIHKNNHDMIGDIYFSLGDIEKQKINNLEAKNYYSKSYNVYKQVLGEDHPKTIIARISSN